MGKVLVICLVMFCSTEISDAIDWRKNWRSREICGWFCLCLSLGRREGEVRKTAKTKKGHEGHEKGDLTIVIKHVRWEVEQSLMDLD